MTILDALEKAKKLGKEREAAEGAHSRARGPHACTEDLARGTH